FRRQWLHLGRQRQVVCRCVVLSRGGQLTATPAPVVRVRAQACSALAGGNSPTLKRQRSRELSPSVSKKLGEVDRREASRRRGLACTARRRASARPSPASPAPPAPASAPQSTPARR